MADPTPSQCTPVEPLAVGLFPLAVPAKGVCRLLSVGLRTVRTWDAAGKLPRPHRIGAKVLWEVSELRAWLAAGCPPRDEWEVRKTAGK